MSEEVSVILDLSPEVQALLLSQGVDLRCELVRADPSLRLVNRPDPAAPPGSRDVTVAIVTVASAITTISGLIIAILNMITPLNRAQEWVVEEYEERRPDGTVIVYRKRVYSRNEQRNKIDTSINVDIKPPELP